MLQPADPMTIPKYNLRKQKCSAMLLVDFEQGGVFLDAFNFFCLFFIFILGLCIGSFLNVVIYRLPGGESITLERVPLHFLWKAVALV
jgi:hypothetical protein